MQRAFPCHEYSPGTIAPLRIFESCFFPLFFFLSPSSPILSWLPHFPPPFPLCLLHNENRCRQLTSSICLSDGPGRIYFLVCSTKCVVSTLLLREGRHDGSQSDEHIGRHICNLYHWRQHFSVFPNQNKNIRIDGCCSRSMLSGWMLSSDRPHKWLLIVGISSWLDLL